MKTILPLFIVLLTGCVTVPKYNYQSEASADPTFIFGDRFGGGSVNGPARSFVIRVKNLASNKCAVPSDFTFVGTTSNNWAGVFSPTIQIKSPAGKMVVIGGNSEFSGASARGIATTTCHGGVVTFLPKDAATYSVDIEQGGNTCHLSILQKLENGQQENVVGLTDMPKCLEK